MTDYEKMNNLVTDLLSDQYVTKYKLKNAISAKPEQPIFLSAPVWQYIYWNKNDYSKTYVQAGELSNFSTFCFCPFAFFTDEDKKRIMQEIQTKLTDLYYNNVSFNYSIV